jgi:hypothetical protein
MSPASQQHIALERLSEENVRLVESFSPSPSFRNNSGLGNW